MQKIIELLHALYYADIIMLFNSGLCIG